MPSPLATVVRPGTGRWLLAAVLAAAGTILATTGIRQEHPAPATVAVVPAGPAVPLPPRLRALGRSLPTTLRIPAIGLDTALVRLGLRPDGTAEVPPLTAGALPGWYEPSVTPGEPGAAVILGHVGSARHGRSVFHRLGALRRGDRVTVGRADDGTVRFVVTAVARHRKPLRPSTRGSDVELRLVSSGGVVVSAAMVQ